jgi:aspartate aminotransferase-like enzyme
MRDPTGYFATPAVNMVYALAEGERIVLSEGMEKRFKRHHIMAEAFRAALNALNLKIVADKECAADTVTAILYPENIDDSKFRSELKRRGIVVAGGLGPLKGKSFRVGHIGNINQNDIISTIGAIEITLKTMGYKFHNGAGLAAAEEKLLDF